MKHETIEAALVAALAEMPAVGFDATNPFLKNKYASLGAMIKTSQPVLAKHGLGVIQPIKTDEVGRIGVETRLIWEGGESISTVAYLPLNLGAKSVAQDAGGSITYLRRYSLAAMLGMYADEDVDGNGNQPTGKAQPEQPKVEAPPPPPDEPKQPPTDNTRPGKPEQVKAWIEKKAAKSPGVFPPSDKQLNLLRYGLELCFAGENDETLEDHRHTVLKYLIGDPSTKKVTGQMFKAIVEGWLEMKQDDGGEYRINQYAAQEAKAIYVEALRQEGQQALL